MKAVTAAVANPAIHFLVLLRVRHRHDLARRPCALLPLSLSPGTPALSRGAAALLCTGFFSLGAGS
jgi:hypothetical protein